MTVWVKEVDGVLTKSTLLPYIKKDVTLKPLYRFEEVLINDIVIVSNKDFITKHDTFLCTIIVYEEYLETILQNITEEHSYHFDYYYLKKKLAQAKDQYCNTIITGSSYGLLGIDPGKLTREVNLSLFSQDLYYSLKGAYEVLECNSNIRNVVLCCGYYYFHTDLSKTKNKGQNRRISDIYQTLFQDVHNCILIPPKHQILFQSDIFDFEKVAEMIFMDKGSNCYFNRSREFYACKEWEDKSKKWLELNENEKKTAGRNRAILHNKSKKRLLSLAENKNLFNEFVSFCRNHNVNLLIVVTPASKYYRDALWTGFKNIFYDLLNEVILGGGENVRLIDLYEDSEYMDEDFIDTDHLSDSGAEKMTNTILNVLQKIDSGYSSDGFGIDKALESMEE